MTVVVDASAIVAALVDSGRVGTWAEAVVSDAPLAAPELLLAEARNRVVVRGSASLGPLDSRFSPRVRAVSQVKLSCNGLTWLTPGKRLKS